MELSSIFPPRSRDANKGDFGHILVIGGDEGMPGSVRLAAEAALRVGAGLVTVATRPQHISVVCASRPEIMCLGVAAHNDLFEIIERASVIVLGPGLGKRKWSRDLFEFALQLPQPKVIDADALNLLAEKVIPVDNAILTPHAGEAARLLQQSPVEIQTDRRRSVRALFEKYHAVIVLKGMHTLVKSGIEKVYTCEAGNPGMASPGMGDVLSGVIGGLLAQGFSLEDAAKTGVFLHATAGDCAAKEKGERGLLALDLMSHLQRLVN